MTAEVYGKKCGMQKNSWIEKKLGLEWTFNKCYLFNKSKIRSEAHEMEMYGEHSMEPVM